jgi:hypothetical protein
MPSQASPSERKPKVNLSFAIEAYKSGKKSTIENRAESRSPQ